MLSQSRIVRASVCMLIGVILALGGCTRLSNVYQTCEKCGSTRKLPHGKPEVILYRSPMFSMCQHRWRDGISRTVDAGVPDGTIVLVRKRDAYGAFILRRQTMEPESADLEWYYRSDGKGTFKRAEVRSYVSGKQSGPTNGARPMSSIEFGPFTVGWSGTENGKGFLYYPRFAHEPTSADDTLICVTNETDIEAIDAADPKWVFRGSPVDPGISGPLPFSKPSAGK